MLMPILSILPILLVIMLERFAWYEMLGGLTLWQDAGVTGNLLLGSYLIAFVGGLLTQRFSLRVVSLCGLILFVLGYAVAALSHHATLALILWSVACGLFKPCFSALLGSIFKLGPERTRAFAIYYGAIQVGSMPSTLVGSTLRAHWGWSAVYASCALAVLLAAVILAVSWKRLRPVAQNRSEEAAIASALTGAPVELRPQWGRILTLLVGSTLFFVGWKQQTTTLVYWAAEVCKVDLPESISTFNPLFAFLLLLTPVGTWSNLRLRAIGALALMVLAFCCLLAGSSLGWLIAWYALASLAEVLIQPIGMDSITALVPERYAALGMAAWLSTMALGGKAAGVITMYYRHDLVAAVRLSIFISLIGAAWYALLLRQPKTAQSDSPVRQAAVEVTI